MKSVTASIIFLVLLLAPLVSGQSITLTVYDDGYVGISYVVSPDNYTSQVEVPLLGEHIEDLIVSDGSGNPLDYNERDATLIVYAGDAGTVNVSYYTPDLTSKQGIVWTLNVTLDAPFTVVLPKNAVVVDLSAIPLEIAGNTITMPPGNQSISYTIEERTETTGETGSTNSGVYLAVGGIVLGSVLVYLLLRRNSSGVKDKPLTREKFEAKLANLDLNDDERRALIYIFDRGGKASQAEVREAIGLPKTTAWRMFKRLERKGLVRILKGKKENWVELTL